MNEPEKTVSPEAAARLQRMFENIYSQTPYFQSMPCTVEKLDVGRVRVGFDISRHSCNYRGIASGGVLAAFCDTLMGMASRTGIGQVIHHGRKTIVVECECYDASGNIIVKGRSSFYILKKLD